MKIRKKRKVEKFYKCPKYLNEEKYKKRSRKSPLI